MTIIAIIIKAKKYSSLVNFKEFIKKYLKDTVIIAIPYAFNIKLYIYLGIFMI